MRLSCSSARLHWALSSVRTPMRKQKKECMRKQPAECDKSARSSSLYTFELDFGAYRGLVLHTSHSRSRLSPTRHRSGRDNAETVFAGVGFELGVSLESRPSALRS